MRKQQLLFLDINLFLWNETSAVLDNKSLLDDVYLEHDFCVSFYILSAERLLLTEKNNKCNSRDQASDIVLRKYFCVKNLCHHVIDNDSRDLQARHRAKMCHLNRAEPREVKDNS